MNLVSGSELAPLQRDASAREVEQLELDAERALEEGVDETKTTMAKVSGMSGQEYKAPSLSLRISSIALSPLLTVYQTIRRMTLYQLALQSDSRLD